MTAYRRAAILSTGTEILQGLYADSNSRFLAQQLSAAGLDVALTAAAPDDPEELESLLMYAAARADLIICSGGLGPTEDDVNRDVFSKVFGVPLVLHPESVERMRARFAVRGREMPAQNEIQAMIPQGATVFPNECGTAPGFYLPGGRRGNSAAECALIALPGPPKELVPMFETCVAPLLVGKTGNAARCVITRTLHTYGRPESELNLAVKDLFRADPRVTFTILAKVYGVDFRITAYGATREETTQVLDQVQASILSRIDGRVVYGVDDETMATATARFLREAGATVATAESCTGGFVAKMLTDIPGSSAYFLEGHVTYSNEAKSRVLGVPEAMIAEHGAVSDPVVRAMAEGVRRISGADYGLGVTGIAGPDGGTEEKPVGLTHVAVAGPDGTVAVKLRLLGDRELNRLHAALSVLDLLRRMLTGALDQG